MCRVPTPQVRHQAGSFFLFILAVIFSDGNLSGDDNEADMDGDFEMDNNLDLGSDCGEDDSDFSRHNERRSTRSKSSRGNQRCVPNNGSDSGDGDWILQSSLKKAAHRLALSERRLLSKCRELGM